MRRIRAAWRLLTKPVDAADFGALLMDMPGQIRGIAITPRVLLIWNVRQK